MEYNYNNNQENSQNGAQGPYTYYQNLYNMFGGYNPVLDNQTKELRRLSVLGGCTVIGFILMQFVFLFLLKITGLYNDYVNDTFMQIGISALAPLLYVVIPFAVLLLIYKPEEKASIMIFEKPKSLELFVLAVFAGLMICFAGDTLTSYISQIAKNSGIEFSSASGDMPKNTIEYIMYGISCAVVPALVEEFAFRGVLMQPLRKFGDSFAIVMSSLIFAIMHGNMVQIPFAFVAGLALGYCQITTGSIWTSVAIHFLNNISSVIISIYYNNHPNASMVPYFVFSAAIVILGIAALIVYLKSDHIKLQKDKSGMNKSLKTATYVCTPPIVLAIIYAMYSSFKLTKISTAFGAFIAIAILVVAGVFILRGIGLLKKDNRIKYSSVYTASTIIMVMAIIIGVFVVIGSGLMSGSSAQYY
jgi:membrane protease YdiL (CAAX protease family)